MNNEQAKLMVEALAELHEVCSILNNRVNELEDNLKFYGHSVNQVEMITKRLSYDLHELKESHKH